MEINGASYDSKFRADWDDRPLANILNGKIATRSTARHYWKTNALSVTNFDTIYALQGTVVLLETTDYDDRNSEKTYIAELKTVTGKQLGQVMTEIQIEFYILTV